MEEKAKALKLDFKTLSVDPTPNLTLDAKVNATLSLVEGISRRLMAQTSIMGKLEIFLDEIKAGNVTTSTPNMPTPPAKSTIPHTETAGSNLPLVEEIIERAVGGNPDDWVEGYEKHDDMIEIHMRAVQDFRGLVGKLNTAFGRDNCNWNRDKKVLEIKGWKGKYQ